MALIVADGVEESESAEAQRALTSAGAQVEVLSPGSGDVVAFRGLEPTGRVRVDRSLDRADWNEFDALVLPGGALGVDRLRTNERAIEFIRRMHAAGRPIGLISHAAWLLIAAGLVNGRILTSAHSLRDDIRNAGGNWIDQEVVVEGGWVSSRGAADLPAFKREIIRLFSRTMPDIIQISESA